MKVSEVIAVPAQIEALIKKIDNLSLLKTAAVMACDTCGGGHTSTDCSIVGAAHGPTVQVNFVGSAL